MKFKFARLIFTVVLNEFICEELRRETAWWFWSSCRGTNLKMFFAFWIQILTSSGMLNFRLNFRWSSLLSQASSDSIARRIEYDFSSGGNEPGIKNFNVVNVWGNDLSWKSGHGGYGHQRSPYIAHWLMLDLISTVYEDLGCEQLIVQLAYYSWFAWDWCAVKYLNWVSPKLISNGDR
ncbi:hypothetical protein Nepgr_007588 [Nepenthes gracilis]|uniref:Uncharacterized protein n=1 Tax=Nepenthes gracilis TaxID=150966 RepID=A0AAD3S762_NEPGR|nr:hypothetical protein Nepgr_007588 [Nepenthes gracilis]